MANTMESLLESAKTYVDVLKSCNSDKVANWKSEDLERAVNWAEYFKRVQGRIQKKPALVRKFDAQLREISCQARLRLGDKDLTSNFLGESKDYLFTVLLENPSLPAEMRAVILQKYASDDLTEHAEKASKDQTLLATLTTIHGKLALNLPSELPLLQKDQPLLLADALCLCEDIEWLLSQQPHGLKTALPPSVCSRLEELSQQENGLAVILLSTVSSAPHLPQRGGAQAVLQWLLQLAQTTPSAEDPVPASTSHTPAGHTQTLWTQPPHLLARVSTQHLEFFRTYIKMLTIVMEKLQTQATEDFQNGVWAETKQQCVGRLWAEVVPHFKALVAAGPNVRDITLSLVGSRAEETMPVVLAVGLSCTRSSTTCSSAAVAGQRGYPMNLWRQLLNDCSEESGIHDTV